MQRTLKLQLRQPRPIRLKSTMGLSPCVPEKGDVRASELSSGPGLRVAYMRNGRLAAAIMYWIAPLCTGSRCG